MALSVSLVVGGLVWLLPASPAGATPGSWSIVASPNQGTGGNGSVLNSVACTSATSCVAVGSYTNESGASQTLVESWNGTSWSIVASPNQGTGDNGSVLNSVACTSTTSCVAVGYYANASYDYQTLVESWNGTSWSVVASPNQGTSGYNDILYAVTCTSTASCIAVGWYYSGYTQTLVESWNGTSWSVVASPNQGTSGYGGGLDSVACTSSASCVAVGWHANAGGSSQTLVESWNGTSWSVVASPNRGTSGYGSVLNSVACTSATSCVAVGSYTNGSIQQTLVESWNGTSWSVVFSPNRGYTYTNFLSSVYCTSATSCVAVGDYTTSGPYQTLVESWNGASWSIVASPNQGTFGSVLSSVYCTSTASCVAVGYYINGISPNGSSVAHTLVESGAEASSTASSGYRFVASDGGIFSFGTARFYGSMGAKHLNSPIVGMASTQDGMGYWFVASDGGIFSYGDAGFYGSMAAPHLNSPIVGMAAYPDGMGYWLVASDGGIFSFGDARFHGSMGSVGAKYLNAGIVGMASTQDGGGYWLVASDGGIFSFGDAGFYGSMGARRLNKPVVGIAATPDGLGYWEVASDGGIFAFGDAGFYGSMGAKHLNSPIVGIAATPDGKGYWLVASDGDIFTFGDAKHYGSMGGKHLNAGIVGMAGL